MNRTALITGASRGLGRVLTEFLAAQGYDLILTARGGEELDQIANRARELGARTEALAGDVGQAGHRAALARSAAAFGRLNLLINNASELGPSPLPQLIDLEIAELRRIFEINVLAPLDLVQRTLPTMVPGNALIINISSDAAIGAYPGWGGYGASKAALDLLSATLAQELRDNSVAVISVDPGDMQTEMHQRAYPGEDISDRPPPETTLGFWAWLLGQDHARISGRRFLAQAEKWEMPGEPR